MIAFYIIVAVICLFAAIVFLTVTDDLSSTSVSVMAFLCGIWPVSIFFIFAIWLGIIIKKKMKR